MSEEAFRAEWNQFRKISSEQAIAAKQSQNALFALYDKYRGLSFDERAVIDELLGEQIESEDPAVRFDALAIVQEFKISSATEALKRLAESLRVSDGWQSPAERDHVLKVLEILSSDN